MMIPYKAIMGIMAVAILCVTCGVAVPVTQAITYQGKLTNAAGSPLTGSYSVTFRLYDAASGGTALSTDTHSVTAANGLFTTTIAVTDPKIMDGRALWLGIKAGTDPEMTPRQEIRPVPYALGLRPGVVGASFTTSQAGTSWPGFPGVNVSTIYNTNPGVVVNTSGDYSNGVWVDTYGENSDGVHAWTEGDISWGVSAQTKGNISHGMIASTEGDRSFGVYAGTSGTNSFGVYAVTRGPDSHGILLSTGGPRSLGMNVTTSGLDSHGMMVTAQQGVGIETNTYSSNIWYTGGSFRNFGAGNGVYGESAAKYGIVGNTNRPDQKYGIYTDDYLYAKGTQVPAADVAEFMPVTGDLPRGTVVVIGDDGRLEAASAAYDTGVAGIVSTAPGVLLGAKEEGNPGEQEIAIAGRVPCKVDASYGSIRPRDLLTSSDTPGHAMKAEPAIINGRGFYPDGTILGKAMGSLESGTGVIEVLVTLQ